MCREGTRCKRCVAGHERGWRGRRTVCIVLRRVVQGRFGHETHVLLNLIIWGAVGPERFFAGRYRSLYWGFALGVLIPLVPWLLHKRLERAKRMVLRESVFSKTVVPIILHGAIAPPATPTNVRDMADPDHLGRAGLCVLVAKMGP